MIKNIKLILFDLDGVIIDTKKNMQLSWKKVQKRFNLNISFHFQNSNKFPFFLSPEKKII